MQRRPAPSRKSSWIASPSVALALVLSLAALPAVWAGSSLVRDAAVGGVLIDAGGLVRSATVAERTEFLNRLRAEVAEPRGDLAEATELRMISLRALQDAVRRELQTGQAIPDEMRMLAGLQRVEYVFVYPERNDIVLAGPAEPWVVREDASVVGRTSGRPVLQLDDLITALRSVEPSRDGGISVSIEPTAEGRQKLNHMLSRVRLQPGQNPKLLEPMMREAFGPQTVKLRGVPADSHYARVLLAADYQMKRLSMGLEEAPVEGLPSYLEMARNQRHSGNENPRWWMACNYNAIKHDGDRLAWQLSGQGVKTLTEQDLSDQTGATVQTGRKNPTAEKWANLMTERFDALASKQAVFGQLRNVMDLSVVATLIAQEGLDRAAGCDLGLLMGREVEVPMASLDVPKAVAPECSFIRGRSGWVVTASGGVDVGAFEVVQSQELDPGLSSVYARADREAAAAEQPSQNRWWWNG
ncbi:DUF1598 domain-containing protein [Candidatus Laterigemmans baculatus]|uniref:DUF1598 domain-containing protein n=1 Tax=Candidatus Laterigemmans baculatus TaxID=2770505 RepID=UPI0013DADF63|nr:DUF1598 domain-containing protein [Candidatus Laterigemmans baculatus]